MTQADVIAALEEHGELTANELVEHTNTSRSAVYNYLSKLRRKHEIENVPIERKKGGAQHKYRLKT